MKTERFSRVRLTFGLLALAGWSVAAVVVLVLWDGRRLTEPSRAFAPLAYGCTVEMPGPPQDVVLIGTETAREYSHYAAVLRQPWERYGLALVIAKPNDFALDKPFAELEAMLAEFRNQHRLSPEIEPTFAATKGGLLTADAQYRSPEFGRVIVHAVAAGSRLYLLIVAGRDVTADRPDVVRYFGSFAITDEAILSEADNTERFRANRLRRELRVQRGATALYLQPSARLPKPLAYWPCDDVEDDETLEVIRGNDAFVDGASAVPSPCGRGLRFPLTDRPALIEEIDDAPELWTLGLWFKVPDGDADVLRSDGPTIDFRGNRLRFGRFDWDGTREFAARPKPPPGTWIHAAFKHDDAGRLEVHLNGEFLGKTDEIVEESDRPLKNLAVGFQHGGEPGQTLEIDELVVFPVRLDQDQIRRLAKLTSDPK